MKFELIKSPNPKKKWRAIFTDKDGKQTHTDFGDANMEDYTTHKNPLRRMRYIQRHKARENWNDPMSAGALSKWILWGDSTSLIANVRRFKERFNLD
jgi:hypothetical protein